MRVIAVALLAGALALSGTPASADRPMTGRDGRETWFEDVACGDVVGRLTGTHVYRWHFHEQRDGSVRFTFNEQAQDGEFVDTEGRVYRVVGSGSGSGQWEPEIRLDHKMLNLQIVGDDGLLGTLKQRYNGREWTQEGSCAFI